MIRRLACLTLLISLTLCAASLSTLTTGLAAEPPNADSPEKPANAVDFARDVLPLLKARCVECHGAEEPESNLNLLSRSALLRGGDSGEPTAIVGKSAESYLLKVISGDDPDVRMPPEGPLLTKDEVATLKRWIDQGLAMPGFDSEDVRPTTDHWSFQPVKRPAVPESGDAFAKQPLDAFILKTLTENGLRPSSRAERRTLIRRLYLVMHGLPPSPEQIDAFAADKSNGAWTRLVNEVLDSPRYGERWAQHWLDLIRFGETHGFETNRERPNAWHFRDWVIDSLNNDKPYDDFVREQIAGDALGEPIATGYLVAGPHDLVKSPDINLTLMQRQDELSDLINTTGTAFLGLTLGCARCHNHKFDPVTQTDFYSMQAVFAGVQHSDRALPITDEQKQQLAETEKRIGQLREKLAQFIPPSGSGFTLLDDATIAESGQRGVEYLVEPMGQGKNPAGTQQGFASDAGSHDRMSNLSGGQYTWWSNSAGQDVCAYRPQARGRFRVWLSWGAGHKTHTRDARFVLDRDGNPATKDDQREIARVDQQHFAQNGDVLNETVVSSGKEPDPVPNQSLWSGLLNAGVYDFTPQTAILLRGGETESAITADVLVLETVADDTGSRVALKPAFRDAVRTELNVDHFPPVEARFVRFTIEATNSSQPCIDELEIFSGEKNVALASQGAKATASSTLPGHEIHKLEHINDGRYGNGRSWISNEPGKGWVQIELPENATISRVEWARDRESKYSDRLATQYRIEVATEPDKWQVVSTSADRLPFGSDTSGAVTYRFETAPPELAKQGREWLAELESAQKERERLAATQQVYAGTFTQPGPTHRLYRGEPAAKREEVSPDALAVLGSLELDRNAPEQHRRLTFANWVTNPDNPLTARVIVNRLWQFHFGTGIVATPSDFGKNGVPPTHPELLDWLASELVDSGWSLKHVHRQILLSQTWQQDSHPNEESRRVDGATLLLWRFPPRRLEAEAMRDCMLTATGQINLKMGGPGFSGFEVEMENVRHFHPKTTYTPDDFRRMIYMTKVRQERESVFGLFDCPDASQVVAARSRSTTPLQALNLLNSGFVMMQAKDFAERLQREAGKASADQVRLAFRLAFGREPDAAELQDAAAFVEHTGLAEFCRALLNSNEFLFIQ
jgi:hypothetical protein